MMLDTMTKAAIFFAAVAAVLFPTTARADQNATYHGALSSAEAAFVTRCRAI